MTKTSPEVPTSTEEQELVQLSASSAIVLIDGICHFCQGATRFIIARDPKGYFKFASLQSERGEQLLQAGGMSAQALDTLVLIEQGRYYTRSTAALRIARRLRSPLAMMYVFILIPGPLRDAMYRYFARNRYRWFGKAKDDYCQMPAPEIRKRFL
ncbi:thiol-disulfide oxidoreductase DCC family protein [Paenibacillus massiliensis]|uniref:thiol-disulfide oxidoreductase DCC family protein n=1 Tax=Paenibacillus massiliensis TaxID=225917 RepID=UPI0004709E70|nr:thiol-disulfide oxidoreductase DCC family protein [Paenibacillus massiliensis]